MKNFLPVILILVSVGLGYFYLRPQYFEIVDLRSERDRYNDVLVKSEELKMIKTELVDKLSRFSQSDLNKLARMIPEQIDVVQLILDMNNIAVKHGVTMRNISTSEISDTTPTRRGETSPPSNPYKVLAISFSFESLYSNMPDFLMEIEESLRIMDVVSVSIKPNPEQPLLQNYELTVHTYWLGS